MLSARNKTTRNKVGVQQNSRKCGKTWKNIDDQRVIIYKYVMKFVLCTMIARLCVKH